MRRTLGAAAALALSLSVLANPASVSAQDAAAAVTRLVPSSERLSVAVGSEVPFTVTAVDADGNTVQAPVRITGPRNSVRVSGGQVAGPPRQIYFSMSATF